MLNLCLRQQCKLYVQIFVTNYIPNNIRACHALDINAALKQNNHYLLMVLVAQAIEAKRNIMSDKPLITLSILQALDIKNIMRSTKLINYKEVSIRYH